MFKHKKVQGAVLAVLVMLSVMILSNSWPFRIKADTAISSPAAVQQGLYRQLSLGATGPDVLLLQKLLNTNPKTQIATAGAGSPGLETNYYGNLTKGAVLRFQKLNGIIDSEIYNPYIFGVVDADTLFALNAYASSIGFNLNNSAGGITTTPPVVVDPQDKLNSIYQVGRDQTLPFISAITPKSVKNGEFVTISGKNFSTSTLNTVRLSYNQVYASSTDGFTLRVKVDSRLNDLLNKQMKDLDDDEKDNVRDQIPPVPLFVTVQNEKGVSNPYQIYLKFGGDSSSQGTNSNPPPKPPVPQIDPQVSSASLNPLVINTNSKIVVMEFEPWFGPDAIRFGVYWQPFYKPLKISSNMVAQGGGYDSGDPTIIKQQASEIQGVGADAILVDLSNAVGCLFNYKLCTGNTDAEKLAAYNGGITTLKNNVSTIYQQLHELSLKGETHLKIIPLIGAQETDGFSIGSNGKNGVQMETDFFLELQKKYPELSVIYEGKPLMTYYHGASQPLSSDSNALWFKTEQTLKGISAITGKSYENSITYRHVGGFFDDQPLNRVSTNSVSAIKKGSGRPLTGFWSFIDRYNPTYKYYPSYNTGNGGIEAFTASYAAPGRGTLGTANAWGTPPSTHAADATLAKNGESFKSYITKAIELRPTFLLINQWNEYVADQGFDRETFEDIEPNTLVQFERYNVVKSEIEKYKKAVIK